MKLRFIGTSSGITSEQRFHSSFILEDDQQLILFDAGDSVSRALHYQKVNPNDIDSIVISHLHADHITGFPSLITQMKLGGRVRRLKIFIHKDLIHQVKRILNFCYLFYEEFDFQLEFVPLNFNSKIILSNKITITPLQNSHIQNKYEIKDPEIKFISVGFLIEGESKLVYTSDVGSEEDLYLFDVTDVKYFITEYTHIRLSALEKFLKKNPGQTIVITHYDDKINTQNELHYLQKKYSSKIILAKEGLSLNI